MNALKMYHVEEIQAFLMDPEKCPTTWGELIRIRQQNPLYGTGVRPVIG